MPYCQHLLAQARRNPESQIALTVDQAKTLSRSVGSRQLCVLAVALLYVATVRPTALAQVRINTIALTGQEAPGFSPPTPFAGRMELDNRRGFAEHRSPFINNAGQVFFGGQAFRLPSWEALTTMVLGPPKTMARCG